MNDKFQFYFDGKPDYSLLSVKIPSGQTLKVEASAMASMDTNISMKTRFKGGFSRLFTGESLFINEFTAQNGDGEIKIAPGAPGDMLHYFLNNETIFIQSSGYVASSMAVDLNMKWQGFKGFFSGEGLFLVKCTGTGDLWLNSYGGIMEVDVRDSYVVDTGHIVAFTEGLTYRVKSVGGYKSFFLSGEGLVCQFTGQGKVWIQSRKVQPFAGWIHPFRPKANN
jgi:uncharacterized protein (TIGR00266 family)